MTKFKFTSTICLITILVGCQPSSGFFTEDSDYLLFYGSGETSITEIQFNGYLKAEKSTRKIYLELRTTNNSEKPKQVNLLESVLTSGKNRNFPVQSTNEMIVLNPGEISVDTITFDAVNSSFLNRFAGINGDLINTYTFFPGGTINESLEKRILFQAEQLDFDTYIQHYGQDSLLSVWAINHSDQSYDLRLTKRINAALTYSKTLQSKEVEIAGHSLIQNPEKPNFQVTSNEILMGGIVFGIKSYESKGEFRIKARIVNHQSLPLELDLADFRLLANGKVFQSTSVKSQNNIRELELQKGQRAHIEFTYSTDQIEGELLFVPNLSLSGMNESLFDSIPLSKVTPPNPELAQAD